MQTYGWKPDAVRVGSTWLGLERSFSTGRAKSLSHTKNGKSILCTAHGKVAGVFDSKTRTFRKKLRREHLLRKPPAIAYDCDIVKTLADLGCQTLECALWDGSILRAPFELLVREGFVLDRGHGEQLALPLSKWTRLDPAQLSLGLWR